MRIQDTVGPKPLAALVFRNAARFHLDGDPVSARVLWSLHQAAQAPYFYECLFQMAQTQMPLGDGYEAWRLQTAEAMERGKELWYLDFYKVRDQPDEPDAVVS